MGVSSAVEHIFNETAMHARAQASNRLARANRASHGSKSEDKRKTKEKKGESKEMSKGTKSKVPKAHTRVMLAGLLMNGMMTGVRLYGTNVGNKRTTVPQAHFHLEEWVLVPRVVRNGLNG